MSQDPATSSTSEIVTIEDDLRLWVARSKSGLFCNLMINTELNFLRAILSRMGLAYFPMNESFLAAALAMIFLASLLYAITIVIGKVFDNSIAIWNPAALYVSL